MKLWQIYSIKFNDLFSYKEGQLDFKANETYLVLGVNEDDAGADSNGAGKSSVFDIVTWCLFGRTPRTEKFDEIVKRGIKQGYASVILKSEDNEYIWIARKKSLAGLYVLTFGHYERGTEKCVGDLTLRTNTLTQAAINRFFGYDEKKGFTDYLSHTYFSSMSSKGFLSSEVSPSERQAVLERFLDLGILDKARDLAKDDLRQVEKLKIEVEHKISTISELLGKEIPSEELDKDVKNLEVNLEEIKSRLDEYLTERKKLQELVGIKQNAIKGVESIEVDLKSFEDVKVDVKEKYREVVARNKNELAFKKLWEEGKEERLSLLEQKSSISFDLLGISGSVTAMAMQKQGLEFSIKSLHKKIELLKKQFEEFQKCPHCEGPIIVQSDQTIVKFDKNLLENLIAEHTVDLEKHNKKLADEDDALDKKKEELSNLEIRGKSIESELYKFDMLEKKVSVYDFSELDGIIEQAKEIDAKIKYLEEELGKKKEDLQEAEGKVDFEINNMGFEECGWDTLDDLVEKQWVENVNCGKEFDEKKRAWDSKRMQLKKIVELEEILVQTEVEKRKVVKNYLEYSYWYATFADIKRNVLHSFIPVFEQKVNQYLADLQIVERVQFLLVSETKKGTIKVGFNIQVFDGKDWADFDCYSGGEKSRILVAVGFALRELSAHKSGGSGFGFLFVDELLDNLDTTGVDYFFELLSKLQGQKFIISHAKAEQFGNLYNKIVARKKDGISTCGIVKG